MTTRIDRRSFLGAAGLGAAATFGLESPLLDDDPLGVRTEFPVTREQAYLNTAYVGPIPRSVRDAAVEEADAKMLMPTPGNRSDRAERAREKFARLFGAKKEEVALLYSTSDGENLVAAALDWKAGDNVVLDELHFQTSFVLYRELERTKGIELRIAPQNGGRTRLEDYDSRIDGRTRVVSLAWVSNRNGFRQDLTELSRLAHSRGALLYVDAIQALGTFETNLASSGADFLCTGAFKWLFGGFGVAPLFVREEHLDRIRPDRYGHAQIVEELPDFRFRLHSSAKKYEYAALAYGAVFQLDAALDFLAKVGLARIEKHGVTLAQELRERIAALGYDTLTPPDNPSPIVAFVHGRDRKELESRLEREKVMVTFREGGSQIRASTALFNNRSDMERLLGVLRAMA
jgi:selenocysteine lyase/cysteine desulfurase